MFTDFGYSGGLSYLSGTEGFAADTVKNYEVVLGDGRVVNANAQENPDLWWALKGGGNNFGKEGLLFTKLIISLRTYRCEGIVTRFDLKAIPKAGGLVWGGILIFLPNQYPDVLKAVTKFQAEGQITDPKAAIIATIFRGQAEGFEAIGIVLFHQDPSDTAPKSLQHFIDIGPIQSSVMNRNYSSLAEELYSSSAVPQLR